MEKKTTRRKASGTDPRKNHFLYRMNRIELSDLEWGLEKARSIGFMGSKGQFIADAVLHYVQEISTKRKYVAPERFFHE